MEVDQSDQDVQMEGGVFGLLDGIDDDEQETELIDEEPYHVEYSGELTKYERLSIWLN